MAQLEEKLNHAEDKLHHVEDKLQRAQGELFRANLKIQILEEQLRKRRAEALGPFSETLSNLQLKLLVEDEPGTTVDEVEAESTRPAIAPPSAESSEENTPKRKAHPGRKPLPENLPRVEETIPCAECTCAKCGAETAVIGYDESERLDKEPAKFFVKVTRREKRACRHCAGSALVSAPLPDSIIEKGLASDRVVIDTIVAKYVDHLPLYRQEAMLAREAGVEIGRATLDGWILRVGEFLIPMVEAMRRGLLGASYLQADETTMPVQMHDKRGYDHQAYLWQYGKPGGETVFDFQMGRSREGPSKFLKDWNGILQTDGYQAYDTGVGGAALVHVGCWAHARRKFIDAVKVNPKDAAAASMVIRMDALFLIDRDARERGLTPEQRQAQREELTPQWLSEIWDECLKLRQTALPSSTLGQAVTYTLNQWSKLKRCLEYAEVELSNNLAENSMRPLALGRKNWLHVGSEKSGPKVAAILSVVESCRRIGAPVKDYLADVLPGMARRKLSELSALTPTRWLAARA